MSIIRLRGLQKTYATGVHALNGVDLDVEAGDFFALLGANGAGKTTMIGILTGLVMKTSGTVQVNGYDLDQNPNAIKSCIGVVPQEFNFNIFEKVENILIDQAGFYGVPYSEAVKRAEELLKDLGLWEKRQQPSRTLSGGMKRRLMIARALMHRPIILLLDEPTAGVDVELRHGMWKYLRSLNEAGTTIVLTTHYLEEVEQLCRTVAILKKGEKVRDSSVADLLASVPSQTYRMTFDRDPSTIQINELTLLVRDSETADVELLNGQTVTDVVKRLDEHGVSVLDVRPTANRIEHVFLEITNQNL